MNEMVKVPTQGMGEPMPGPNSQGVPTPEATGTAPVDAEVSKQAETQLGQNIQAARTAEAPKLKRLPDGTIVTAKEEELARSRGQNLAADALEHTSR